MAPSTEIAIADYMSGIDSLRESQELLKSAQDAAGLGIHDFNPSTGELRGDDRVRELWGVGPEEQITYETFLSGLHPDDRGPIQVAVDKALDPNGDGNYQAEYRVTNRADGITRWVAATGRATFQNGKPTRLISIVQDVTARKRVENERLRLVSIVENSLDFIGIADPQGNPLFVNKGGRRLVGMSDDYDVTKTAIRDYFVPEERDFVERVVLPALITEGRWAGDLTFRHWQTNAPIPVYYNLFRIDDPESGKPINIATVTQDMTERRRAEAALREQDQRKDEFLATLAHELRNPLAPIRNSLQIMKLAAGNPEVLERSRSIMERQIEQLTRLIEDLMDLSRISRGLVVLRKSRMPLGDVVRNAVETSRPLIDQQGHELIVNVPLDPIYVNGDGARLAQVFANLLNNAAKYTERGGRIRLCVERQGNEAVVSVEDNGVGIPTHMLSKIFDMFTQVDRSLEKSQGGLGIGLNIAKYLVEMHDGSIGVHSDGQGLGSRFTVRLPMLPAFVAATPNIGEKTVSAARRRVLVVDDNSDAAETLHMMLSLMGNDTKVAADGAEAVTMAAAFLPDVILMDIGMPQLNGYDACRQIRKLPCGERVVMVACTGWGQEQDRRKSQEAGFDFHMVKPMDLVLLEKVLATERTPR